MILTLSFLLCDDSNSYRSNRLQLLDPDFNIVGVGGSEDENNLYLVILLTENFEPNSQFVSDINNYKAND